MHVEDLPLSEVGPKKNGVHRTRREGRLLETASGALGADSSGDRFLQKIVKPNDKRSPDGELFILGEESAGIVLR